MKAVNMLTVKYNNQTERTEISITRSSQAVSSAATGLSPCPTALHVCAIVTHVTQFYLKKKDVCGLDSI
jgi:ABC-type nickel/cobalt efflux system permease component RcnA